MRYKFIQTGFIILSLCAVLSGCGKADDTLQEEPQQAGGPGAETETARQEPVPESTFGSLNSGIETAEYEGRYLKTKDGEDMIVIDGQGPVILTDKSGDGNLFDGLEDGDLVTMDLGPIRESCPGSAEAYTCTLTGRGQIDDIDGDVLKRLQELGWLSEASLGKMKPQPMVFLNGRLFVSTGREAYLESKTADGQITSVVGERKIPKESGQANFDCEGADYIQVDEDGVAVLSEGRYILFLTEDAVDYEGRCYKKASLSEETIEWLGFYNNLSKEDQAKISMVPPEFVKKAGDSPAVEARETQ